MKPLNVLNRQPMRFQFSAMSGVIERRMLVNFRCEPTVLARLLPPPFRPKLIHGWGMAGICLIRLSHMHPMFLPLPNLLTSENAAHRIAVEWDENGKVCEGVFVPRRDTDSWLNQRVGGKLFPGNQHAATFEVHETESRFKLAMRSEDGVASINVVAQVATNLPNESVFKSLAEASDFFRGGAIGWSPRPNSIELDGMELVCREWRMEPLVIESAASSFFGDVKSFPAGTVKFDSALLMRNMAHEWQARGRLTISQIETI